MRPMPELEELSLEECDRTLLFWRNLLKQEAARERVLALDVVLDLPRTEDDEVREGEKASEDRVGVTMAEAHGGGREE